MTVTAHEDAEPADAAGSAPGAGQARTGGTQAAAKFWDRIAERYARKPVSDEAAYRRKLEITRGYLGPETEVLEVGCGTGSTALAHAPFVKHVHAIDISQRMIEIARGKAGAGGVANVTFEQSSIDGFAGPAAAPSDPAATAGRYGAILALSILHLLEDRDAALASLRPLLRPGGVLVTSTPCLGDSHRWFRLVGPVARALGLFPLVRVFTRDELEASIEASGFAIERSWQPGRGKAVFIVARKAG